MNFITDVKSGCLVFHHSSREDSIRRRFAKDSQAKIEFPLPSLSSSFSLHDNSTILIF